MPKISQTKQLRWESIFDREGLACGWPEELTQEFWDKRSLIARKEKTGVGAELRKHQTYFEKNQPPELWGRNWGEVEKSVTDLQKWMNKSGKAISLGFKSIRDEARKAEKTFTKSSVITKKDVARAKAIADAADIAMVWWNKNSLGTQLGNTYDAKRKEIYDSQVRLMASIEKSTKAVPAGVKKRLGDAKKQLRGFSLLDEEQQKSVRSDIGDSMQTAARNMTQSASNFVKSADMGISLEGYNENVLKAWTKRAEKLGNSPGAGSLAREADEEKLNRIVNTVQELLDLFEANVVPLRVARG